MNKNILLPLIALAAIGAIVGLYATNTPSNVAGNGNQKSHIAATIFPVYDIAKNVAGDFTNVELILPPGASPHTFDATPSTLTKLQGVTRIFAIGQGIDSWSLGIVDNLAGAKIVELDKNIVLRASSESNDEYEGEDDPHYWLDPNNAIIMANTIADELAAIDPTNAGEYRQNATTFATTLEQQDKKWQTTISNLPINGIVTFHDAFFYFANHFGLSVITTFEPFPGKEPTPSYLQELENEIKKHGIRVLFREPQLYGASLQQFAIDQSISVSVLDPLGGVDGRQSYIELINYNVQTIAEALR